MSTTSPSSSGVEEYDVLVVGGGSAGAFAAATAAQEDVEVGLLERKSEEEAGHIACGDAIHNLNEKDFPEGVMDLDEVAERADADENIGRALYRNRQKDKEIEIDFGDDPGSVVDRWEYGRAILEGAWENGADIHLDTVVQDVLQNGEVEGVRARHGGADGREIEYQADVVIDAAGSLSLLQDKADFSNSHFDTNVNYSQFCSAYRDIIRIEEEPDWMDALVIEPLDELGYFWLFPRGETEDGRCEINAGLGFQMDQNPMQLVDVNRRILDELPEISSYEVVDQLGAALPTRRTLDSMVADGFISTGDAAATCSPTTGKGITGAVKSGHYAGLVAAQAVKDGDTTEKALWDYNTRVQREIGPKLAAQDAINVASRAYDLDALDRIILSAPVDRLMDAVSGDETDGNLGSNFIAAGSFLKDLGSEHYERKGYSPRFDLTGYLSDLEDTAELAYVKMKYASALRDHYKNFPDTPGELPEWKERRDSIDDKILQISGADPKY